MMFPLVSRQSAPVTMTAAVHRCAKEMTELKAFKSILAGNLDDVVPPGHLLLLKKDNIGSNSNEKQNS